MLRPTRLLASSLLTFTVLFGAVACGGNEPSADPDPSTPSSTDVPDETDETAAPETTTTAEAPTTTTLPPPAGAETAADAALALYGAWHEDDRQAAAGVAEPEAIDAFWMAAPGDYQLYRHCDDGDFDTGGCLFRNWSNNNTIQVSLEHRDTGWVVVGAFFSEE